MNASQLLTSIRAGEQDGRLTELYGAAALEFQRGRYAGAVEAFAAQYGADREVALFSVAGRSELSGNHTDHNHGRVVAASIDLDIIAVASKRSDTVLRIQSEGFPEDTVDFTEYTNPVEDRYFSSASILAGMCRGFARNGHAVGGFDAYTTSNVQKGSGLSSSAAFEDMVGNILNHFYNKGDVSNVEIAKIAQYAENQFFGKPCGLMDQVACAAGGIVAIDFDDPSAPVIEQMNFDLTAAGYNLCIVSTGGNHADLSDEYASIPSEMKAVAAQFGKCCLREVSEEAVLAAIPTLRNTVGDRAILRSLHFFEENKRVAAQTEALRSGNVDAFFAGVLAGNYDIEQVYVDGLLKIGEKNVQALGELLEKIDAIASDKLVVVTVSAAEEELTENVKKYL
jgi:galactokinase